MALTVEGIRQQVISKYHEGQEITLWLNEGERREPKPVKLKILTFNPNGVLMERRGIKHTFSYWEVKTLSSKPTKNKEVVIPDIIKHTGRPRSYKVDHAY
jgi:hypothetical protein